MAYFIHRDASGALTRKRLRRRYPMAEAVTDEEAPGSNNALTESKAERLQFRSKYCFI